MALEVNFYAGTRALYDAEPSLDPGGLYALIDGLGLYRGSQPIAGPCPFDINLLIEKTTEEEKLCSLEGGFQSTESVQTIKEFFASRPGNGSRPIRVSFTYTSGTQLSHVDLNKVNLMMYNVVQFAVPNDTGLVGKFIAIEFKPKNTIDNELIDCVMYQLVLQEPDSFYMYIKEFSMSASDIPTSEIVKSINENRDAIVTVSTNLNNEVTRAKKAESDLNTSISNEVTRAKKAESDLSTKISDETTRASKAESDLSTKISDESDRAKNAESTLQKNIDANSTKISTNTSNISKNAQDISAVNTTVSSLSKTVDDLSEKVTAATGDVSGLVDKINKNASDISDLTTKVNKNSSDISTMNTTISQSQTKIDNNTTNITTIQTSVSDLDKRIDAIESGGTGGPFWIDY